MYSRKLISHLDSKYHQDSNVVLENKGYGNVPAKPVSRRREDIETATHAMRPLWAVLTPYERHALIVNLMLGYSYAATGDLIKLNAKGIDNALLRLQAKADRTYLGTLDRPATDVAFGADVAKQVKVARQHLDLKLLKLMCDSPKLHVEDLFELCMSVTAEPPPTKKKSKRKKENPQ